MVANTITAHGVLGDQTSGKEPKTRLKVLAKGIDGTLYVLPTSGLKAGDTISVTVE